MNNFTDVQRRRILQGLSCLSVVAVIALTATICWSIYRVLALAAPALIPVILGFLLALFFKPYYNALKRWVRNPSLATLLVLLTVFVPIGLLTWYAGNAIVDGITDLCRQGPSLLDQVVNGLHAKFPQLKMTLNRLGIDFASIAPTITKYTSTAFKAGLGAFKGLSAVLSVLISLIFFVFFLTTRDRSGIDIVRHLPFLKEETQNFIAEQFDAFLEILVSFFRRQIIICLIEGCFYGLGFWLAGLPYGFLIGFALGMLNLIPFFGSVCCLPIALPLAYFGPGGSFACLLVVLGVWGAGQILDGYFITPHIQGNRTGLGYAGVIFSFIFWGTLLGPLLGMLLAIPLSAFCVVLWRALKNKYIRPLV